MVSPREKLEDIETYADTLEELKFNSKPHISTLTELARDYGKNRQAEEVIKIIEKRIMHKDTPITHKLPTLYLLDSILKNHSNEYKRPIEAVLAKVFVCVFSNGDEKIRLAMFKLRQLWTPFFEYEILNVLDIQVRKIDSNWPYPLKRKLTPSSAAPAPIPQKAPSSNTTGNIHVNPKFLGEQKSFSEDSQDDGDDELRAMEEKIKQIRKEKERKRKIKEMEAILEKERQELERVDRELKETEAKIPKISTSGSKTKDSSSSASTLKSSSSSKASNPKVCFMVKAC